MRYYLIPLALAVTLGLTARRKRGTEGVLVSSNDLTGYGEAKALKNGARLLSKNQARIYANQYKITVYEECQQHT